MIPMHWGAFITRLPSLDRFGGARVLAAAAKSGATILTPELGETVALLLGNLALKAGGNN